MLPLGAFKCGTKEYVYCKNLIYNTHTFAVISVNCNVTMCITKGALMCSTLHV